MFCLYPKRNSFSNEIQIKTIIIDALYDLFDTLYQNLSEDEAKLVHLIEDLNYLVNSSLTKIFHSFQSDENILKNVTLIAVQLRDIAQNNLICLFNQEIYSYIYSVIVNSKINWNDEDLEVTIDDWSFVVINRLIQARSKWGKLYNVLKDKLFTHIENSLLHTLSFVPELSANGFKRINLSITNFREISCAGEHHTFTSCTSLLQSLCLVKKQTARSRERSVNQHFAIANQTRKEEQKLQQKALQNFT